MKTRKMIFCVAMALVSVNIYAQSITLDEAIKTTATEMGQRLNNKLPSGTFSPDQPLEQTAAEIRQQLSTQNKIAVLNFSSTWQELSAYVINELNNAIVRNGSLTVVDRQQLDLVRKEQNFQISGDVDDKSQQSIGKFLGAQFVLSGSFTIIGKTNRFRIQVIAVETGVVQYSNSIDIKNDSILVALMPKPKTQPAHKPVETKPLVLSPLFNFVGDLGGGNIFGFEFQIGLQFGASVNNFALLVDAVGGLNANSDFDTGFSYHVGGLMEYGIAKIIFLGVGGGIGGNNFVSDDVYPYIRGSASVLLSDIFRTGLYYDYTFDYGSRFGLRYHIDFGKLL